MTENPQITPPKRETGVLSRWPIAVLGYGLFWSWNLIFLAFMTLGFAPIVLPEVITAVRANLIPPPFLLNAVILTAIPAVAVVLGASLLRRSPGRLLVFGYGVEGPLMLILAIRLFAIRDATWAVTLLLAIAGVGLVTLLWQLLDSRIEARGPLPAHLHAAGLALLLATGLYVGGWIAFYALPLAVQALSLFGDLMRDLFDMLAHLTWREVQFLPLWVLGTTLIIYTATLFIAMPVVVPVLYVRAWWRGLRTLAAGHGWPRAASLTAAVLVVCAALFAQANRQPQHVAFQLLEKAPATPGEAAALLKQQSDIRQGLLNAYLAPYRYLSAVGEVRHVSDMYEHGLRLTKEQAARVQHLYEIVARPLLYEPAQVQKELARADNSTFSQEPAEAARLYQSFFDQPIVDGERDALVRAARSTWSGEQAQAAWLSIDDREVHLVRQEISVVEHSDWAEIELYEVYQNKTTQRQEVVYYFSLPESAVITGVWLGNSPERGERFAYRVSPRGAAQELYRSEVRRNVDPALVEQIGPRQYRLRAFPVEPMSQHWDGTSRQPSIEAGPLLHLWLTARVMGSQNAWPLPQLAERRNVYWDAATVRRVNGKAMKVTAQDWLPASAPAESPVTPAAHRVDFPGGQTVLVRPAEQAYELRPLLSGMHLAVVLDRSRSMADHAAGVRAALARLGELTDGGAGVDVYLSASQYRGEAPSRVTLAEIDPQAILYYGGQNAAELLAQFDALKGDRTYNAILVLTDSSGYELGSSEVEVPRPAVPVWMVHVDGGLSLGYDDATLEAIQASGGGVAAGIEEALTRLALGFVMPSDVTDLIDGYTWSVLPTDHAEAEYSTIPATPATDAAPLGNGVGALAARRLIMAEMHRQRAALDVDTLDALHAIATEHSIVTPYSSMIVLVTDQQQKRLDDLEANDDRFEREYEQVGETMPQNPLAVTAVPEPEEWLLLILAAALLAWYAYSRQRGVNAPRVR